MNILAFVHLRNIHRSTGAGRVARELMEHVSRCDGVNMHILADQADHRTIVPRVGEPWESFPYHLFSSSTSIQQAKWLVLNRPTAETYWPAAQIVHCTGESYVPSGAARLVVTVHDAAYFDRGAHREHFTTFKQQVKWRTLYGTLSRTADVFHTVSQFSAERLTAAFPQISSRVRVIHNGVSATFFEPPDHLGRAFLAATGLERRPFILLPGGLQFRKNADLVLKAWPILLERNPDLKFVVVGDSKPEYTVLADSLGKSFIRVGFVDDAVLRALYHAAIVVWFPSRYEGFGLPILEAMACGAPVVGSSCTAIPEIAGGAALLVSPDALSDHIDALESVIDDGCLRDSMRKRGRLRAEQFTWGAAAYRLHNVYSSLL